MEKINCGGRFNCLTLILRFKNVGINFEFCSQEFVSQNIYANLLHGKIPLSNAQLI